MSIVFGLFAAFAWGLHDIFVRLVSQKTNVFSALLIVLFIGFFFQGGLIALRGEINSVPAQALWPLLFAGITFTTASIGLYKAFEIGPVQLVAPIVATFSILSILWGVLKGNPLTLLQSLAVLIVFLGLYIVVSLANTQDETHSNGKKIHAILWAAFASISSYAALSASLFGVVTILIAWAFLRERMVLLQWFGVALTFIGVAYLGAS